MHSTIYDLHSIHSWITILLRQIKITFFCTKMTQNSCPIHNTISNNYITYILPNKCERVCSPEMKIDLGALVKLYLFTFPTIGVAYAVRLCITMRQGYLRLINCRAPRYNAASTWRTRRCYFESVAYSWKKQHTQHSEWYQRLINITTIWEIISLAYIDS